MKRHISFSIAFLVLILFATPHQVGSTSVNDDTTRPSLKGLQGLWVNVYIPSKDIRDFEKCSVNIHQIKTDVELKLRFAGINVLPEKEALEKILGAPCLYVSVMGKVFEPSEKLNLDAYVVSIQVEVVQGVQLLRNPEIKLGATTWGSSQHIIWGSCNSLNSHIRDRVKDKVDEFISAYLSVNPK